MPPKSTDTSSIASATSGPPRQTAQHSPETLRHEHHDDNQQQAENEARRILDPAQQLGNDDIEDRTDDGAADRAKTADHHHAQERNRKPDAKAFRIDVAHEIGEQATGDGGVKRADGEHGDLVAGGVNPERSGSDLAFPDHEQRAAGAATADIPRPDQADRQESEGQVVEPGGVDLVSRNAGCVERKAATAAGQAPPFEDDLLQYDAKAKGCDREVDILQTKRGHGGYRSDRGREQGADQKRHEIRKSRLLGQERGGVGADAEQGSMTQADLPGIACEQIKSQRHERENPGEGDKIEAVAVEAERRRARQEKTQTHQYRSATPRFQRLRDAVDVGDRGHALRTLTRPKMPSGRMISTAMMTMNVMASANEGET